MSGFTLVISAMGAATGLAQVAVGIFWKNGRNREAWKPNVDVDEALHELDLEKGAHRETFGSSFERKSVPRRWHARCTTFFSWGRGEDSRSTPTDSEASSLATDISRETENSAYSTYGVSTDSIKSGTSNKNADSRCLTDAETLRKLEIQRGIATLQTIHGDNNKSLTPGLPIAQDSSWYRPYRLEDLGRERVSQAHQKMMSTKLGI